jgi:xylan 1,4-beta-xylosidase
MGQFGLRAKGGINKPSFYDFALLHKLGESRIPTDASNVLATKRSDGTLAIAVWNLVNPDSNGRLKTVKLSLRGIRPNSVASVSKVDSQHGNALAAYKALGSPRYPTPAQIDRINRATQLPPPTSIQLTSASLDLSLEPNALVLVEIQNRN